MLSRRRVTEPESDPEIVSPEEGVSGIGLMTTKKKSSSSLGWSCDQWVKTCVVEYATEIGTTGSILMQKLFVDELVRSGRYHLVDGEVRKCS